MLNSGSFAPDHLIPLGFGSLSNVPGEHARRIP